LHPYQYAYADSVLNTDPTGKITSSSGSPVLCVDLDSFEALEKKCKGYQAKLESYGYEISEDNLSRWSLRSLEDTIYGLEKFMQAASWTASDLKDAIKAPVFLKKEHDAGATLGDALHPNIRIFERAVTTGQVLRTIVHESSHLWDQAWGGSISDDMMKATSSKYVGVPCQNLLGIGCPPEPVEVYCPIGAIPSDYARTNHTEDWAESVTNIVLPHNPNYRTMSSEREKYVRSQFKTYRRSEMLGQN